MKSSFPSLCNLTVVIGTKHRFKPSCLFNSICTLDHNRASQKYRVQEDSRRACYDL